MRLSIFLVITLFFSLHSKANDLFGGLEDMLGGALKEMETGLNDMQNTDNSGNFNSDGSINFEQALENAMNEEVEWSPYTRKNVNAPMRCPNWYSADMLERQEAKERYSIEMMWWNDCGEFYPDAEKPYVDLEQQCQIMGPEMCAARDQYIEFNKMRNEATLEYSLAVVKVAEAIGLKENAAGLRATLEFLNSEGIEGTTEYEKGFAIAYTQTLSLIDEISNKVDQGYIPSDSEVVLLQEAIQLKNKAGTKWVDAVKERDKLKKMGGIGNILTFDAGFDDFAFWGMANNVEIIMSKYEKTVSQNTGKNLNIDDTNLDKELDELEF